MKLEKKQVSQSKALKQIKLANKQQAYFFSNDQQVLNQIYQQQYQDDSSLNKYISNSHNNPINGLAKEKETNKLDRICQRIYNIQANSIITFEDKQNINYLANTALRQQYQLSQLEEETILNQMDQQTKLSFETNKQKTLPSRAQSGYVRKSNQIQALQRKGLSNDEYNLLSQLQSFEKNFSELFLTTSFQSCQSEEKQDQNSIFLENLKKSSFCKFPIIDILIKLKQIIETLVNEFINQQNFWDKIGQIFNCNTSYIYIVNETQKLLIPYPQQKVNFLSEIINESSDMGKCVLTKQSKVLSSTNFNQQFIKDMNKALKNNICNALYTPIFLRINQQSSGEPQKKVIGVLRLENSDKQRSFMKTDETLINYFINFMMAAQMEELYLKENKLEFKNQTQNETSSQQNNNSYQSSQNNQDQKIQNTRYQFGNQMHLLKSEVELENLLSSGQQQRLKTDFNRPQFNSSNSQKRITSEHSFKVNKTFQTLNGNNYKKSNQTNLHQKTKNETSQSSIKNQKLQQNINKPIFFNSSNPFSQQQQQQQQWQQYQQQQQQQQQLQQSQQQQQQQQQQYQFVQPQQGKLINFDQEYYQTSEQNKDQSEKQSKSPKQMQDPSQKHSQNYALEPNLNQNQNQNNNQNQKDNQNQNQNQNQIQIQVQNFSPIQNSSQNKNFNSILDQRQLQQQNEDNEIFKQQFTTSFSEMIKLVSQYRKFIGYIIELPLCTSKEFFFAKAAQHLKNIIYSQKLNIFMYENPYLIRVKNLDEQQQISSLLKNKHELDKGLIGLAISRKSIQIFQNCSQHPLFNPQIDIDTNLNVLCIPIFSEDPKKQLYGVIQAIYTHRYQTTTDKESGETIFSLQDDDTIRAYIKLFSYLYERTFQKPTSSNKQNDQEQ